MEGDIAAPALGCSIVFGRRLASIEPTSRAEGHINPGARDTLVDLTQCFSYWL